MRALENLEDPGRILMHASLYLWKQWREYPLAAWEAAESIIRRAYDDVEEEDRLRFVRSMDAFEAESPQLAVAV